MEQTAQTQEPQPTVPQKPAKPTSIKILQWVYLLLFVAISLFNISVVLGFRLWSCTDFLGYPVENCSIIRTKIIIDLLPPILAGAISFGLFKFTKQFILVSLILNVLALALILIGLLQALPLDQTWDFENIYWVASPIFLAITSVVFLQVYKQMGVEN